MAKERHESITAERVLDAIENRSLENLGFCRECGDERGGCEPDARNYPCENDACRAMAVDGAKEYLFEIV